VEISGRAVEPGPTMEESRPMTTGGAGNGPLGLVVSGAAARGPYEAGAVAEVMRVLPPDRPLVLLGTSSGAITVALLAQFADHGTASGEKVAEVWREVHEVYRNPVLTLPRTGAMLAGRALGLPAGRVSSVLDVAPLRAVAEARFDPAATHALVGGPRIRSLGVAATVVPPQGAAARTRLFVAGEQPTGDEMYATDVVGTRVEIEHLLASAAIPALFPPVRIHTRHVAGWYVDGGVRLNAPLQAALRFGVSELLVISGHSLDPEDIPDQGPSPEPDIDLAAAVSVRAVLTDALGDDIEALRRHNTLIHALAPHPRPDGGRPRPIPFRVIAPPDGELAGLAAGAYGSRRRGPWDGTWGIERLLAAGGDGAGRNELLSLVFFDPDYAAAQVERGRVEARQVMARDPSVRWPDEQPDDAAT
jgi:NTE family protein